MKERLFHEIRKLCGRPASVDRSVAAVALVESTVAAGPQK
jgi:hypothetical protein